MPEDRAQRAAAGPGAFDWLDSNGDALYRYALARTRNRDAAEDLVQETLLAAIHARERFRGDASTQTWLFSILRRKIVDHFRRLEREGGPSSSFELSDALLKEVFNDRGLWKRGPSRWRTEFEGLTDREEFWAAFARCVGKLPPAVAEAFMLRERENISAEEVGKVLGRTPTTIWVMLHRARTALRECLERTWFAPGKES